MVACGLPADARFATWLLDHLTAFVQGELANHLMGCAATGMPRRRVINGFVAGITSRIVERLLKLCKPAAAASANSRALVAAKQAVVKARMDEEGIKLHTCSGSTRQTDSSSRSAGRSAGNRASFARPVSGKAGVLRIGK
jgi:hypothetical protein